MITIANTNFKYGLNKKRMISLGQKGLILLLQKVGPLFKNGLNKREFSYTLQIASKSGLKSLNTENQTFRTKNDFLIY